MRRLLLACLTALAALSPAVAQDGDEVAISARFEPAIAKAGDAVTLLVTLDIKDGWHLYGSKETLSVPVRLVLNDTGELRVAGDPVIPPGVPHEASGITSYELTGKVTLRQELKVPAGAADGARTVRGVVPFMVCDESSCLPPDQLDFTASLGIGTPQPVPAIFNQKPGIGIPPLPGLSEGEVFASARIEPTNPTPGSDATLIVTLEIAEGWHVYGSAEVDSTPTRLTLLDTGELRAVGAPDIPPGQAHDSGVGTSHWLKGKVEIRHALRIPEATTGEQRVRARVDYMVCDDARCLDPTSQDVEATVTVAAAGAPLGTGPRRAKDFAWQLRTEPADPRPGEAVDVILSIVVREGMTVRGGADGQPTRIAAKDPRFGPVGQNRLPAGTEQVLPDGSRYELGGAFELRQAYRIPDDLPAGSTNLPVELRYELIDAEGRLPRTAEIAVPLTIGSGKVRSEFAGAKFEIEKLGGLSGLLWLAFLAGLFALLMPCTYPMIPITISFFTKQATTRGASVAPLALAYGLGIVLIFILIGLLFGPLIVPFATHWITNAVITAVFLIFALSLFGLVDIQPPQFLMNLAGSASTKGGYGGVFLMGMTLVISSFTCTVPFVGALLGIAARGGTLPMVLGMTVFGLTMAVPFVILSLIPGRLRKLPRAGEWMNSLKVFLGFVEVAAALKFASNVDLALNSGPVWLPRELFLWLWAVLFGAAALYLIVPLWRGTVKPGPGRIAGIVFSLSFAGWCGYGGTGQRLDDVMTAIAPPSDLGRHVKIKDDYERAVAVAIEQEKLLFVNFTGFT